MTIQEIKAAVKEFLNSDSEEIIKMYVDIVDEMQSSTFYTLEGLIEDIVDAIEEAGHEENEYSEYKTLKKTELEDIYHQVK